MAPPQEDERMKEIVFAPGASPAPNEDSDHWKDTVLLHKLRILLRPSVLSGASPARPRRAHTPILDTTPYEVSCTLVARHPSKNQNSKPYLFIAKQQQNAAC